MALQVGSTKEEMSLLNVVQNEEKSEPGNKPPSYLRRVSGILAVFAAVLMIVTSATCVQLIQRRIPDFELNTIRFLISFVSLSIGFIFSDHWVVIPRSEIPSTLCYTFLCFTSSICIFVAFTFVPVSSVDAIYLTSSIASGLILFRIGLGDKIRWKNLVSGFLCVCGVFFVLQPQILFNWMSIKETENNSIDSSNSSSFNREDTNSDNVPDERQYKYSDNNVTHSSDTNFTLDTQHGNKFPFVALGYILPLFSGFAMSGTVLLLQKRPESNAHQIPLLFWTYLLGMLLSAIAMIIFESVRLPTNWYTWLLALVHGLMFVFIWPLYIYAAKYISGNTVTIVNGTSVVCMLVPQYTVLSSINPGNRNWMEVLGAVLVLFGSAMGSVFELLGCK